MGQEKFVEDSLLKIFTWSILEYYDPFFAIYFTRLKAREMRL